MFFPHRKVLRRLMINNKFLIIQRGPAIGNVILAHGSKLLLKMIPLTNPKGLESNSHTTPLNICINLLDLMLAVFRKNFPFELELPVRLECATGLTRT